MADVSWIKLSTNIFENRKIRMISSMPDGDAIIVAWLKLLCLAGNINDAGMVYFTDKIPYTEQMLATQFNMNLTTVQLALKTFLNFGMIETTSENVICISNWEKYQNIEGMEKIREQNRIRNIAYRERKRQKLLLESSHNDVTMTSYDATDKEEEKNKNKKKNKIINYSDDPDLNQAILSFIEFRKSIKKPMTDRAVELMIMKLNELSDSIPEQIAILNQSILNGWQGVFPLKDQTVKPIKQSIYQKTTKAEELNNAYNMMASWADES